MNKVYDPILCMNVPVGKSKAKDASWKAWTLYIDGKWVKSFTSEMAPIKEAQKFMKENYPGKVGKLVRNTGSTSGYSISGSESRDSISSVDKAIKACDEKSKVKITDGKYSKIFDDYPAYVDMVKERLTNTKYKSDSDFYRAVEKARKEVQKSAQHLEDAYNKMGVDYNIAKSRINAIYNELHNDKVIEFLRKNSVN